MGIAAVLVAVLIVTVVTTVPNGWSAVRPKGESREA